MNKNKIKIYINSHRAISAILGIVLIILGYWSYGRIKGGAVTHYVLASVEKGTLIVAVSGSGQVSASVQVDVKSKASGDAVYIGVKNGEYVEAGTLIVQLDSRNAQKTVRDAEVNLESARIALEKLRGPEGLATPRNKQQAQDDLAKAYDDGFNSVSNTFLDLPTVMSGLQTVLLGTDKTFGSGNQLNIDYYASSIATYDETASKFRDDAYNKYQTARISYDKTFLDYKSISRFSSSAQIETMVSEAYETTKNISEAVKSSRDLLQFHEDKLIEHNLKPQALVDVYLVNLNTYTGTSNSHLGSLLTSRDTIRNDKDAILNSDLDLRSQNLSLRQKENALADAKDNLKDYYIRAPFSGTIAKVNIKKLDSVGSGTAVATLVTNKKLAEISFNEIDVAKIKIGQKATLTFDAVPKLSIAGEVAEIDTVGTVSQGVVTYNVKVSFDTQDERVKTGMSVTSAIVTDIKQDVLMVPNSAVKTRGENYYVQVAGADALAGQLKLRGAARNQGVSLGALPEDRVIEIGLANDSNTEIISGLKEGEVVVSRTVAVAVTAAAPAASSLFSGGSNNRSGAVRGAGR